MREYQFDGLVGPTHNYAGLSRGNVASAAHVGETSNPRAAARQGLAKMKFVRDLGVRQAVLPPHDRPHLATLRKLGFAGSDDSDRRGGAAGRPLPPAGVSSSASAMWTANAATVAPSRDAADGKVHLTPANLQQMFHRAIEPATTARILRAIFPASSGRFVGARSASPAGRQLRRRRGGATTPAFATSKGAIHLSFAWGRRAWGDVDGAAALSRAPDARSKPGPRARLHALDPARCQLPAPGGRRAGSTRGQFHTDVLAVGNERFFMLHELAFVDGKDALLADLRARPRRRALRRRGLRTTSCRRRARSRRRTPSTRRSSPGTTGRCCASWPPRTHAKTPTRCAFLDKVVAAPARQ